MDLILAAALLTMALGTVALRAAGITGHLASGTPSPAKRLTPKLTDDPRVAACGMLSAMLEIGGVTIARQRAVIDHIGQVYALDGQSARELALRGARAKNDAGSPEQALRLLAQRCPEARPDDLRRTARELFADADGRIPHSLNRAIAALDQG